MTTARRRGATEIREDRPMRYRHTQRAPLGALIAALGVFFLAFAWLVRATPAVYGLAIGGCVSLLAAATCNSLTVQDVGNCLSIRFGPLPVLGTRIRYADISLVEPARSNLVDGWGVHWIPGKGWIFNLWGFDCVRVILKSGKSVRIGTDDVAGLLASVQTRIETDGRRRSG